MKKIVYIAHSISGDVDGNLKDLYRIIRAINLEHPNVVPLAAYVADVLSLDDNVPSERDRGMENGIEVLRSGLCHELWLTGDKISYGMKQEVTIATFLEMPVIDFINHF